MQHHAICAASRDSGRRALRNEAWVNILTDDGADEWSAGLSYLSILSAPCQGLSISISLVPCEKTETWYLYLCVWLCNIWRTKFLLIFEWQARDLRVKIGISPKRNINCICPRRAKEKTWEFSCFQVLRSAATSVFLSGFHTWHWVSTWAGTKTKGHKGGQEQELSI